MFRLRAFRLAKVTKNLFVASLGGRMRLLGLTRPWPLARRVYIFRCRGIPTCSQGCRWIAIVR